MPPSSNEIFLWQNLALFLAIWACIGVGVALLLIMRPQLLVAINRVANRWISTRMLNQLMDRSINIEHCLYQRHRSFGIAVVLGACYLLFYFSVRFDKAAVLNAWAGRYPVSLLEGGLDALVLSVFCGATFALIAGLFLGLRPSLFRGMEVQANQWVSLRRATKPLDIPRNNVDQFVLRHARRMGWLLLLASLGLLALLIKIAL